MRQSAVFFLRLLLLGVFFPTVGCDSTPLWPEIKEFSWATYSNAEYGFSVLYPDYCELEKDESSVIARYRGKPIVTLRFVTREEALERGLWGEHTPVDDIALARTNGKKFIYRHYDGPFYMKTVSYVIPQGDKFIGLEFRSPQEELNEDQRHILESFAFEEN